jgi:uncharacterized protein YqjF (DUF2071 family)
MIIPSSVEKFVAPLWRCRLSQAAGAMGRGAEVSVGAIVLQSDVERGPLRVAASGTQFLPVSGYISDRLLVTYRVRASRLARLVPAPFEVDSRHGHGFVSVCAVEIVGMRVATTPRALSFDNREFLYRIGVRLDGQPTFITLRSDVSSRALAWLGRHFSHYRPHLADVTLSRSGSLLDMRCTTRDGTADGAVAVDLAKTPRMNSSLFASEQAASAFLLGMRFSADVVADRVRVQPIEHSAWHPRWVDVSHARFSFLDRLAHELGAPLEYDCTLAVQGVRQVWGAAHWR